jgi:hypothetical protein
MIPVDDFDRYIDGYSLWACFLRCIRPVTRMFQTAEFFALHSSIFKVAHGRLGEVVSMVGDCRPPPPGNPRQPSSRSNAALFAGGYMKNPLVCNRLYVFISKWQKNGGENLPGCKCHSFNIISDPSNLKILNRSQYFKIKCSFISCAMKYTVLEFVNSHCHLYGFRLVGPPSIAITNVLLI